MKKIILPVLLFTISFLVTAQKPFLDKITDNTCRCLEAAKDKIKNANDFDKIGEDCITRTMSPYMDSIAKEENVPVEELNGEGGKRFGQKVGMKLLVKCPFFVDLLAQYNDGDKTVATGVVMGTVTAVQLTDHVYLDIKDPSGRITKLIWLEYFTGSGKYKSNPAALKGKQVEIEWKEAEIYLIAKKDFSIVKEITKLTVK